jgi:hypothetical protein
MAYPATNPVGQFDPRPRPGYGYCRAANETLPSPACDFPT